MGDVLPGFDVRLPVLPISGAITLQLERRVSASRCILRYLELSLLLPVVYVDVELGR